MMQPILANLESTLIDTSRSHEILRSLQQQRDAYNAEMKLKKAAILKKGSDLIAAASQTAPLPFEQKHDDPVLPMLPNIPPALDAILGAHTHKPDQPCRLSCKNKLITQPTQGRWVDIVQPEIPTQ